MEVSTAAGRGVAAKAGFALDFLIPFVAVFLFSLLDGAFLGASSRVVADKRVAIVVFEVAACRAGFSPRPITLIPGWRKVFRATLLLRRAASER